MIVCALCQSETPMVRARQIYCPPCRPVANARKRDEWRAKNPDRVKELAARRFAAWKKKNALRRAEQDKAWRSANAERIRARKSSPEYRAVINERRRQQYRDDRSYNVHVRISSSIRLALKGGKAGRSWEGLVGYTLADLMTHLERQFSKGMNWENMGRWHIDHIRPKRGFDQSDPVQFRECWALTNLRPLWAPENQTKAGRREHLI